VDKARTAWNVIGIHPAAGREDVRVVQADLKFMQAEEISAQVRKRISSGGSF
jgi:hypothetical protein